MWSLYQVSILYYFYNIWGYIFSISYCYDRQHFLYFIGFSFNNSEAWAFPIVLVFPGLWFWCWLHRHFVSVYIHETREIWDFDSINTALSITSATDRINYDHGAVLASMLVHARLEHSAAYSLFRTVKAWVRQWRFQWLRGNYIITIVVTCNLKFAMKLDIIELVMRKIQKTKLNKHVRYVDFRIFQVSSADLSVKCLCRSTELTPVLDMKHIYTCFTSYPSTLTQVMQMVL